MEPLSNYDYVVALQEARNLYSRGKFMDKQARYDAVISLSEWKLFSVGQLAQITGLSTSTLYGMKVSAPEKGSGRFNPQSLDTLIQLRLDSNNDLPVNKLLLNAAAFDGNSRRVIARLTGLRLSTVARNINADSSSTL